MMTGSDIQVLITLLEKTVKALEADNPQLARKKLEGIIGGLHRTVSESHVANAKAVLSKEDAIIEELDNLNSS